jgi:hypothetical protein
MNEVIKFENEVIKLENEVGVHCLWNLHMDDHMIDF